MYSNKPTICIIGNKRNSQKGHKNPFCYYDKRKGLPQLSEGIPIQMCNFHQVAIIGGIELRNQKYKLVKSCGNMFCF
jgi:hypothetical protein